MSSSPPSPPYSSDTSVRSRTESTQASVNLGWCLIAIAVIGATIGNYVGGVAFKSDDAAIYSSIGALVPFVIGAFLIIRNEVRSNKNDNASEEPASDALAPKPDWADPITT